MASDEAYYVKEEEEAEDEPEGGYGVETGLAEGAYPEAEEVDTTAPQTPPGLPPHLREQVDSVADPL